MIKERNSKILKQINEMKKAYSYMCFEEIDESNNENDLDEAPLEKVKTFFFDSKEDKLD